jgi:hypothetical protein
MHKEKYELQVADPRKYLSLPILSVLKQNAFVTANFYFFSFILKGTNNQRCDLQTTGHPFAFSIYQEALLEEE